MKYHTRDAQAVLFYTNYSQSFDCFDGSRFYGSRISLPPPTNFSFCSRESNIPCCRVSRLLRGGLINTTPLKTAECEATTWIATGGSIEISSGASRLGRGKGKTCAPAFSRLSRLRRLRSLSFRNNRIASYAG